MSQDYQALKLPALSAKSFCHLPSNNYLVQILELNDQEEQINKVAFEWLTIDESNALLAYLQTKGASKDFEHREGEAIKLNMLEWLSIYNMLINDNNQFKLESSQKDLMLRFIDRFDLLIGANPVDITMTTSFEQKEKVKTKRWMKLNKDFRISAFVCIGLLLVNMVLKIQLIQVLIPAILIYAGIKVYQRENTKAEVSDHVLCCMYTQMLVEHSY